jgi:hypothetical protein
MLVRVLKCSGPHRCKPFASNTHGFAVNMNHFGIRVLMGAPLLRLGLASLPRSLGRLACAGPSPSDFASLTRGMLLPSPFWALLSALRCVRIRSCSGLLGGSVVVAHVMFLEHLRPEHLNYPCLKRCVWCEADSSCRPYWLHWPSDAGKTTRLRVVHARPHHLNPCTPGEVNVLLAQAQSWRPIPTPDLPRRRHN